MCRVDSYQTGLPRATSSLALNASRDEASKARLDVALGSLVWWLVAPYVVGGLKLGDHYGPFQPRPFCDSMKCDSKFRFLYGEASGHTVHIH